MPRVLTKCLTGHSGLTAFLDNLVQEDGSKILFISEIPNINKLTGMPSVYPEYDTRYTVFYKTASQ